MPQPKALLLLDKVDHPELLQPPQSNLLTGRHWLHVLATTIGGRLLVPFLESPEIHRMADWL